MTLDPSSWLPGLLPVLLKVAGTAQTARRYVNFVGVTAADDSANDQCTLTVSPTTISGLGTGVGTFLATPSSANLRGCLTDETGTGAAVFATSPSIATPTFTGATSTYQGTKLRVQTVYGETQSTTATTWPVATFTMSDETSCAFDFVGSMKGVAGVAKSGHFSGKVCYQRNAAGAPALVGAAVYATPQCTSAGDDMTFDVVGNVVRVIATAIDGDDRNWTCELRVAETLAT